MSTAVITVGPHDSGRRMSLEEFEQAEGVPGHVYELSRGVVTVVEVPDEPHLAQIDFIRQQFAVYRAGHPGRIHRVAGSGGCKIVIADLDSERHPDVAVYKTPRPSEKDFWSLWIPEIVIEVVSLSSRFRDYEEKPEEYLRFGVREYWIIDAEKRQMTVLRRSRGKWSERIVRPGEPYTIRLLPGLEFDCARVFDAAAGAEEQD